MSEENGECGREWLMPTDPALAEHLRAMLKPGAIKAPPLGAFQERIRPTGEADMLVLKSLDEELTPVRDVRG